MKYVLALSAVVALLGAATLPALAKPICETSNHVSDGTLPPICLAADTKEKHPDWYRDGGYCVGGATTTNVTAFTKECEPG